MSSKPFGAIDITLDRSLATLEDDYAFAVRQVLDDEGLDLAAELQANSPQDEGDLAGGWEVIPTARRRISLDVRMSVRNEVPAALYRAIGRGPGKPPPIKAIEGWAKKNGINPWVLRRQIANHGTERWRSKQNCLGMDPVTGDFFPDSPITRAEERVTQRLNTIAIPKRPGSGSKSKKKGKKR